MKKYLSLGWFFSALWVLPCILDLENGWCLVVIVANLLLSYRSMRRHAPDCFAN